jgi:Galactose oxidase, central domain
MASIHYEKPMFFNSGRGLKLLILASVGLPGYMPAAVAQTPGTFTSTGNMTAMRSLHTATLLPSGKVLLAGGSDGQSNVGSAELYDPSTRTFTATGSMTTPRAEHTATLLANGKVLITGGGQSLDTGFSIPLSSAEIYDPATEAFSSTGNMSIARAFHTATLLANGKVLIAGGTFSASPLELYDPSTATFTTTATTLPLGATPGDGTAATLLADGTVFFATLPYGSLGGGVVYNPATDTFSYRGDQGSGYSHYAASLLLDGQVLISGGGDLGPDIGSILPGAQLFDPSTGSFRRTGNMTTCRYYHTSTLLPDGTTLIVGGFTVASDSTCSSADLAASLASSELYEPSTGVFTATGNMSAARVFHTATLLSDGTVLIAGGSSATADIYHPAVPAPSAPLLSISGDGTGQGAIQHAGTYQVVSADNPAVPGEVIVIYCTGLIDGSVIPPQVSIGGQMAEILWFGDTPGYPGLNQINVVVPDGVAAGDTIPVRMNYMGRPSNLVTIGVQ